MLLVRVLVEPVRMFACTVGGNSALPMPSQILLKPLSAPVLLMARPTTAPTTAPSRKHPNPPVATVMPVAAPPAAVARASIALLAATHTPHPRHSAPKEGCSRAYQH